MQLKTLKTKTRATGQKRFVTQTRAQDSVPAVLYGAHKDVVPLMVDRPTFEKILHAEGGAHAVVQLEFEDAPEHSSPAIIKALQRHPVRDDVLHADFVRIRLDEKLQTQVVVVLVGRSKGVVDGGVIDHQIREVDIECLALDMPDHLEVDISHLEIGDSVHVSDIQAPENVTILTEDVFAIASVHMPRVLKTAEEEEAEAAEALEAEEAQEAQEAEEE